MTALIITFILLLLVGAPIFFAVGISASAFVLSSGNNSLAIITQKMVDGIISTTLMALPLFIFTNIVIGLLLIKTLLLLLQGKLLTRVAPSTLMKPKDEQ